MPHLDFTFGTGDAPRRRDPDAPLRLLVIGDFSGRGARGECTDLADRTLHRVDLDRLDGLFAALAPRLPLRPAPGHEITLALHERDDLHPDRIYDTTPAFAELRALRARLADPRTFADAARALGATTGDRDDPAKAAGTSADRGPAGSSLPQDAPGLAGEPSSGGKTQGESLPPSSSDFERLLGGTARPTEGATARSAASPEGQVRSFIEDLVAPHVVPDRDPSQPLYLAAVDDTIGALLRTLLHDPAFQALEAAWRGLAQLVEATASAEEVEIAILDAAAREWVDDAGRSEGRLARLLATDLGPGETGWTTVVVAAPVGREAWELTGLAELVARAAASGTIVLGAAAPPLLGIRSFAETPDPRSWSLPLGDLTAAWSSLRAGVGADHLALAAPRVLLRLPYGKTTDPIERFAFEELPAVPPHEHYLWGNPAFALAAAAVTAAIDGRVSAFGSIADRASGLGSLTLRELPVHVVPEDGGPGMKASAEAFLTEGAAEELARRGFTPIISIRNTDRAKVWSFRSIAE